MAENFTKRREPAAPGSIPDRLQMFAREVRFYREIGPAVGVRVPACYRAEENNGSTLLELEDLSSWRLGADPADAARMLATLHQRWEGKASTEWPWLSQTDVADLVEDLYSGLWGSIRDRADLTPQVRNLGADLVGEVQAAEHRAGASGPHTLIHGDASARNMRTSPTGEIALLDWEDLGVGPGIGDLAWFLLSSVDPDDWDRALDAYGNGSGLGEVLPAVVVQGLLSLSDEKEGSPAAIQWIARLEEAAQRV
jgi:hypothetical protein